MLGCHNVPGPKLAEFLAPEVYWGNWIKIPSRQL